VISYVMSLNPAQPAATQPAPTATPPAAPSTPAGGTPAATGAVTPAGTAAAPEIARPSNPGGPGSALNLVGRAATGQTLFAANCQKCHGPQGLGGVSNPGSDDGSVPALNPIDSTIANSDPAVFAFNMDLFLEHGSVPGGSSPQFTMPAWGDQKKLTPQQIADVMAYVISLNNAAGTPTPSGPEIARPSNPGGPGQALDLNGDATSGQTLFVANCQKCHGPQGTGSVSNPGSDDGTVPPLNPIDKTIAASDPLAFAYNVDLFVEHGSSPGGSSPQLSMPAWGDQKKLTPQQIADVITYVMSLNK
jgi:mono/diheme cytochrome c family protein